MLGPVRPGNSNCATRVHFKKHVAASNLVSAECSGSTKQISNLQSLHALVSISSCRLLFRDFPFSSPTTEAYHDELPTLAKLSNLCLMGYGFELVSLSGNNTQSLSNK